MAGGHPTRARPTLILFAKEPRLGFVKTRLARDIGAAGALTFYRGQLSRSARLLRDGRWRGMLALTPDAAVARAPARFPGLPDGTVVAGQGEGDLGARMARALETALTLPAAGPALLIGADIPGLTRAVLADAFAALRRGDLVFGPAEDGGFWLVGARRPRHLTGLFDGVQWSRPDTLSATLANVPRGVRVVQAARLSDVDTGVDLVRLKAHR